MTTKSSRPFARRRRAMLMLAGASMLAACATPYQPHSLTGGYKDSRISDSSYVVEFYGNGKTSREVVWAFWMNRCAELTQKQGFAYFSLAPKSVSWYDDGARSTAHLTRVGDSDLALVELKGGGGGGGRGGRGGSYVYVPGGGGGTITTWSAKGTVLMFRSPDEPGARYALRASSVLDTLKPLVLSQGRGTVVTPQELIRNAMATPPLVPMPPDGETAAVPLSAGSGGTVEMNDLQNLLPK